MQNPHLTFINVNLFNWFLADSFPFVAFIYVAVNVVDGEMLTITKVSRLHMAPYLCVRIYLLYMCIFYLFHFVYFFVYIFTRNVHTRTHKFNYFMSRINFEWSISLFDLFVFFLFSSPISFFFIRVQPYEGGVEWCAPVNQ